MPDQVHATSAMILKCTKCESPHFVLKVGYDMTWLACCEGCGTIFSLLQGLVEVVVEGV